MAAGPADDALEAELRARFTAAAAALAASGTRSEALAEFDPARRRLGVVRRARLRPIGRVWRLGVLLLTEAGGVRATGTVTRAVPPGHPGHVASSVEARRELRDAAHRGPFAAGETVHLDAPPIDLAPAALRLATGPLLLRGDRPLVRWSVSAPDDAARDLDAYLAERVDLLIHPPRGAT